jgi:transposase
MKQMIIAGVDVSKSTLDIFIKPFNISMKIANTPAGFKRWLKVFKQYADEAKAMVVMEHTGKYSCRLESFLRAVSIDYCKISALQIKRSLGVTRGKNDKVDAERIADYGWLRREILTADSCPAGEISSLKELLGLRSKLVRDRSGYICREKEIKMTEDSTTYRELIKIQRQLIDFLTRKILLVEEKIKLLIAKHPALYQTCQLLRSIKGVGWIIAAYMISCTENFRRFSNARKFNCYAGLAPFTHESGSSIKARSRISHLANKEAKKILNLAASTAIQHDLEMKTYYQRRVKEGKTKMSCLNIIRSKIVARMFAVIKRQTPYQPLLAA